MTMTDEKKPGEPSGQDLVEQLKASGQLDALFAQMGLVHSRVRSAVHPSNGNRRLTERPDRMKGAAQGPVVDLGLREPAPHGLARDAFLASHCGDGGGQGGVLLEVLPDEPHAPRAQLGIDLLRHAVHRSGLKQQRHQTWAGSP